MRSGFARHGDGGARRGGGARDAGLRPWPDRRPRTIRSRSTWRSALWRRPCSRGRSLRRLPDLRRLRGQLGGYAFASLDGRLRCESREAHRLQVPASATKVLTALCALDVVADVSRKMTLRSQDVRDGSGYTCYAGDEVSFEDALYSMMLPSSNTMAESVATAAGGLMLAENRRLGKAAAPGAGPRPTLEISEEVLREISGGRGTKGDVREGISAANADQGYAAGEMNDVDGWE